jgi:hypothetical protein
MAGEPAYEDLPGDSSNGEKRKWMTKHQAESCQKAFDTWQGSLKGRSKEVQQLAVSIGLTVSTRQWKPFYQVPGNMGKHVSSMADFWGEGIIQSYRGRGDFGLLGLPRVTIGQSQTTVGLRRNLIMSQPY